MLSGIFSKFKKRPFAFVKLANGRPAIEILRGRFKGIIYVYGAVKFGDVPNSDGKLPLKFEWDVVTNPNDIPLDKKFLSYIGDVLVELMNQEFDEEEYKRVRSNRTIDSTGTDAE